MTDEEQRRARESLLASEGLALSTAAPQVSHTRIYPGNESAKKIRFSRNSVLTAINERIDDLEVAHGFEPGWGWARVEGRDTEVIVAFGRYEALLDLREDFEL